MTIILDESNEESTSAMAMEAITQTAFNRRKGIYTREMFTNPPIHAVEGMELPLGSVVHYLPEEDKDYAPDESWWLLRGLPRNSTVWMEHITKFTATHGKVRVLPGDPANWVRKWHMKHPTFKRVVNRKTALTVEASLLVINHALARHWLAYNNNRYLGYQIAKNTRDNIINELSTMVSEIDRVHFIPVRMPSKLYEINKIKSAAKQGEDLDIQGINRFGTVEGLFFLELWRFMENRESSMLSKIPQEHWGRVRFLLTCNNSWFMINLHDLDQWVEKEVTAIGKDGKEAVVTEGKWNPEKAQRILLSNLVQLVERALVAEKKQSAGEELLDPTKISGDAESSNVKENLPDNLGNLSLSKTNLELEPLDGGKVDQEEGGALDQTPDQSSMLTRGRDKKSQSSTGSKKPSNRFVTPKPTVSSGGNDAAPVVKGLTEEEIDQNIEALEKVDALVEAPEFEIVNPNADPIEEGILSRARQLARDGLISAAALRQSEKLAVRYKEIKNPFGNGTALEASRVTSEERQIVPKKIATRSKRVFDESMQFSSIESINTQYARETYKKDIFNSLLCMQRSGIALTDMEVDTVTTMSGSQLIVLARSSSLTGKSTTLPIILPNFEADGTYKAGGTRYRMKTQRQDAPIRLVKPGLVYLTSYYGKVSISRSDLVVFDYDRWLGNAIAGMEIDGNPLIKSSDHGNVFDQSLHVPKAYSTLSRRFKSLQFKDFTLIMDRKEIERMFSEKERATVGETDKKIICGIDTNNKPVIMLESGEILVGGKSVGRVEDVLSLDLTEAPHAAAMVRIRGQNIPLGVVIASYIGLNNMLKHLGGFFRRVQSGARMHLEPWETAIRFADESIIIDTRDSKTSLLMMGFKKYSKQIRQLSVYGFDKTHSYQFILDAASRNSATMVELELLDEQFVDPMTERDLIDMKEPTTWRGLLWRALELILTDYSPDEMDGSKMRFKLHERIVGMVYGEQVKSIRKFKMDSRVTKAGLDMKPTAVWQKITTDSAIAPLNDCNPVGDLRAQEGVTYIGHGGRSKVSMMARHRKMSPNDVGNIGESNVDSGDTGINIYYSANPNVKNTSGVAEKGSVETTGISSIVSTSAMLGVCLDVDDARRAAMSSIQWSSARGAKGYRTMPLGTGYEEVIGGRVSEKFAYVAKENGKVVSIKNDVMKIQYQSGAITAFEVGRVFTGGEGHTYPNDILTTVKAGDSFKEGDALAFNESWFEQSPHDPKLISMKHGVPAYVMLCENINTLEDGSVISPEISKELNAAETEIRELVFAFSDTIHNLVKEGISLEPDDILCTIETVGSVAGNLLSESTVETLNLLADNSPKAKVHGHVDYIEVLYNGDVEDMSESIRSLVDAYDKKLRLKMKDLGKDIEDGRTDEGQRVSGQSLQVDTLVIRLFISHSNDAVGGNKAVMGNQLKTVHGQVSKGQMVTESGRPIGFQYADVGVENRVVPSPRVWGISNLLLVHTGSRMVKAYRGS